MLYVAQALALGVAKTQTQCSIGSCRVYLVSEGVVLRLVLSFISLKTSRTSDSSVYFFFIFLNYFFINKKDGYYNFDSVLLYAIGR